MGSEFIQTECPRENLNISILLLEDLQSEFLGRQPLDTWEIGLNMAVVMPLLGWTWSGPDGGVKGCPGRGMGGGPGIQAGISFAVFS